MLESQIVGLVKDPKVYLVQTMAEFLISSLIENAY